MRYEAIKKILNRALWDQGLRHVLSEEMRRHEWKAAHGYRKFFKTRAEQVMKPLNVELLIGHGLGLQGSYYKPTEQEVLADYLKAVHLLTINYDKDKSTLQKQVAELTEKSKDENYAIKGKLAEKEKEIEAVVGESEKTKKEMRQVQDKLDSMYSEYHAHIDKWSTFLETLDGYLSSKAKEAEEKGVDGPTGGDYRRALMQAFNSISSYSNTQHKKKNNSYKK
jgi:hypothetical protein